MKILSVNSKYPGSTHDSFIWNNCNVLPAMQELSRTYPGNYYLLGKHKNFFQTFFFSIFVYAKGDSGYALRPWMLTPIRDPANGSPEENYNDCQMSTRNIIERVNGVLKMRFRCLLKHRVLHYKPQTAAKIINTCCALHNLCVENNLPIPDEEDADFFDGIFNDMPLENEVPNNNAENTVLQQGRSIQNTIIRRYFS